VTPQPPTDPQVAPAPHARRAFAWRRYLGFWGMRVDVDVDDELALHYDMRVRDCMARGMSEPEARAAAARRMGDLIQARQQCLTIGYRRNRRMTRTHWIDALRQDVRFALRMFARQKGWTAVAVLTLALGIGASAAVFSVMRSVVLHPFQYRDADRVWSLWLQDSSQTMGTSVSPQLIRAWQAGSRTFESIQEYVAGRVTLTGAGEATRLNAVWMQQDLPRFAGVSMLRGRSFTAQEAADSTSHVAVIEEGLWRQRFGGRDVLGSTIVLDQVPYTIVGVAPAAFRLPAMFAADGQVQVWLPIGGTPPGIAATIGRLRPGVSVAAARRELAQISQHATLAVHSSTDHLTPQLMPLQAMSDLASSAKLLSAGVVLLLMISCANVAHLLLARGAARQRELSIRRALGASRGRLLRQGLTEACLLSLAGCAIGLGVAYAGISILLRLRPQTLAELDYAHMDAQVLLWAMLVSLGTGVLFALLGARQGRREDTAESLKGTSLSGTGTRRHQRVRSTLVITEMALSAMLLAGAVLLVRSIIKLEAIEPGFDPHDVYTMAFTPPQNRYKSTAAAAQLVESLLSGARNIPGVRGAVTAAVAPPHGFDMIGDLQAEGTPDPSGTAVFTPSNTVGTEYMPLLRIPIAQGRNFDAHSSDRKEAIINEAAARKLWPGSPALGRRFRLAPPKGFPLPAPWYTVVGVVPNTLHSGLEDGKTDPMVYFAAAPGESGGFLGFTLVVRAQPGVDPSAPLHRLSLAIDPAMAPPAVEKMDHAIDETIAARRFTMTLLSAFAIIAVLLAAVGLYGVIAYTVAQHTREIGIRIALGAMPHDVASMVLVNGAALSITGLVLGLVGSFWGMRLIRSSLFGVQRNDPISFVAVALLLIALSAIACIVPTRRAMRVDPLIAMRAE